MKKYKYKLNMLEPGTKMIKMIGVFLVLGLACYLLKISFLSSLFVILAVIIGILLWILILIEQHQDNVLNEQAIRERRERGED